MTHAADLFPHLPLFEMGFNHAGTEIWYSSPGFELTKKICLNSVGSPENFDCSNTTAIANLTPSQHMQYVGIDLAADWCGPSIFLK